MDTLTPGSINLSAFVRATAGRMGTSTDLSGGVGVAGPIAVVHGYVDAAIPTDVGASPAAFIDDATSFFRAMGRTFVMWVPSSAASLVAAVRARGLVATTDPTPAMATSTPVDDAGQVRVQLASDDESFETVGDLCERGYQQPGMAWLMARQQSCRAHDSFWHIAFDEGVPVSAACGFRTGRTGGIYSVATPPEFRGRGYAAAVTGAATNHLFDAGVTEVVLQASKLGYGVYERLGFATYDHYERFTVVPKTDTENMPTGNGYTGAN